MDFKHSIIFLVFGMVALGALSRCGRADSVSDASEAATLEACRMVDPFAENYREVVITRNNSASARIPGGERLHDRVRVRNLGNLRELFLDSNKYQYAWAERFGISPIGGLGDAYHTRRPLVRVESCDAYAVDRLTHSLPFLVPEAELLLRQIGYDFIDTLRARGADGYRIKVTSLLRTPATVKSLRRRNRNATDSSTHQFGTTFDISWSNFVCADTTRTIHEGDLKNILAEVLDVHHRAGRCMIVFEKKSPCFHITVTPGRKPGQK